MPELPDVEGFRRTLAGHGAGQVIRSVEVHDPGSLPNATPSEFVAALTGRRFSEVERHGKWLLAPTDGPTMLMHFGMTGGLIWEPGGPLN